MGGSSPITLKQPVFLLTLYLFKSASNHAVAVVYCPLISCLGTVVKIALSLSNKRLSQQFLARTLGYLSCHNVLFVKFALGPCLLVNFDSTLFLQHSLILQPGAAFGWNHVAIQGHTGTTSEIQSSRVDCGNSWTVIPCYKVLSARRIVYI